MQYDDRGYIRAIRIERVQQQAKRLNVMDAQTRQEFFKEANAVRLKTPQLLGKRAQDALSLLLTWAIATEWCDYDEWLPPVAQEEMLECFCDEALSGIVIEQAPFRKKRSKFTDKAYEIAKPLLLSFRDAQGIPNNQPLTIDQGREAWSKIAQTAEWKRLVTRHARAEIGRLTTKKGHDMSISIQYQTVASSRTLRAGATNRWKEEFGG
jgi:hypothetical protein